MNHVFYFSICAAFLANAGFLAAELAGRAAGGNRGKKLAALFLFAAAFAAGQLFYRGAQPRGGYDNNHDFQYLSLAFLRPGSASMTMAVKEASPLVFDALSDAATGFSLGAAPVKNRLLMFLAAVLLFACLRAAGLGLSAACFGFALFYFNFLAALNANTFATTAANAFFLFSAIYAAAAFETGRRDLKGLLWALAAFFLVWTGRYELALLPGTMLCSSLLRPDGALRALALRPGSGQALRPGSGQALRSGSGQALRPGRRACPERSRRGPAWLALGLTAGLCAAWALLTIARQNYNGPLPLEALKLLKHLRYQLGEGNLGVILPAAAGLAPYLAAAALAAGFFKAWSAARRGPTLLSWAVAPLWALCFCSIFMLRDSYPLQFMRHRLYFFVPFVFIFAAAWEACFERPGARAAALKWGLLACFCAVYLGANLKAARALEPEKRTNDLEWALLLKASRNWPAGCALMFPDVDSHHRQALLEKYFPLLSGDCGRKAPSCVIKYLPPIYRIFNKAGQPAPRGYTPASPAYAGPLARPLFESAFTHRFYTGSDLEERGEIPLRTGFYYADTPPDRAWLLNREGLCTFKNGNYSGAENAFREALALDPGCGGCGLNLAASLAFGGKEPEALLLIGRAETRKPDGDETALLAALKSAAKGDAAAAETELDAFIALNRAGDRLSMGFAYRQALTARRAGQPK